MNPGLIRSRWSLTYTTEDFRCHVLVKLAKDDPHVIPLWAEEDVKVSDGIVSVSTKGPFHGQLCSQELC